MSFLKIYDTTLRDGSQAEGISFTVEDKIRIAQKLDELGVHYVEGGWPGSNPRDIDFFSKAIQIEFVRKVKSHILFKFKITESEVKEAEEILINIKVKITFNSIK